jgi:hypothetical protein
VLAIVTIMPITGRSICSFRSYCDNNRDIYAVLTVIMTIMTITGRSMCSANSYCENNCNNRTVYVQC